MTRRFWQWLKSKFSGSAPQGPLGTSLAPSVDQTVEQERHVEVRPALGKNVCYQFSTSLGGELLGYKEKRIADMSQEELDRVMNGPLFDDIDLENNPPSAKFGKQQ